jgi:hypothetical protein
MRRVFAAVLLLLAGCRDYTPQIQAVQATPIRDVAFGGEARTERRALKLADYIAAEFPFESLETSWSGRESSGADGTALVEVAAILWPHDRWAPLAPERIDLRFSYDPASGKVAFLGMEFDGTPAVADDGGRVHLVHGFESLSHFMETRGEALADKFGKPLQPNPDLPTFGDVQDAPAN